MTSESPIWALKKMKMDCIHIFFSKITDLGVSLNKKEWATLASAAQRWHRAPRSAPLSPPHHGTAAKQSLSATSLLCGTWARLPECLWELQAGSLHHGWRTGTVSCIQQPNRAGEGGPPRAVQWTRGKRRICRVSGAERVALQRFGVLGTKRSTGASVLAQELQRGAEEMSRCNPAPTGEASPEALTFPQQSSCCCPHPSPQAAQADRPPWVPWARQHCSQSTALQEHLQGHPSPIPRTDPTWSPSPAV